MRRIREYAHSAGKRLSGIFRIRRTTPTPAPSSHADSGLANGSNQGNVSNPAKSRGGAFLASYCGELGAIWKKPAYRFSFYVILLILLFVIPIKPGPINGAHAPNGAIPLIGQMEILCNEQNAKLLKKATAAYLATKAVTKTVAVLQEMQLNIGPVSVAPGSYLSGAMSSVDRVADGLFIVMSVMVIEKCTLGVIAWLCFKILFPCAIILRMIYDFKKNLISGTLASFMFKLGVLLLLFFPTLSYFTAKIDNGFAPVVNETLKEVEESADKANALAQAEIEQSRPKGIMERFSAVKDSLASMFDKFTPGHIMEQANELLKSAEAQTNKLFNLFAAFSLSVIVIPIGIIIVYWKIFSLLSLDFIRSYKSIQKQSEVGNHVEQKEIFNQEIG